MVPEVPDYPPRFALDGCHWVTLVLGQPRKLGGNMKKYFEYTGPDSENKSGAASKFWEVSVDGSDVSIRFGKIGINGQTTLKQFGSSEEASEQVEKMIKEKTKKGYVEK
jgi:predicted DNA-binding WGR domain protein